jgi:hypothetical protein
MTMPQPNRRARLNNPEIFPMVSEGHAAAIGYVAMQWSAVEDALVPLIGALLGIERLATHILIGGRPTPSVLDVVSALIQLSGEAQAISDWKSFRRRLDEARPLRNDAIHAEWRPVGSATYALRAKITNRLTLSFVPISTDRLNALADQLLTLAEDIVRFASGLRERRIAAMVTSNLPPGAYATPSRAPNSQPNDAQTPVPRPRKQSSAQKRAAASRAQSS